MSPPPMPRPFYRRQWFQLVVGLSVTFVCLGWAFQTMTRQEDPGEVLRKIGRAFREADYRTLPVMLVLLLTFYGLKAWRWGVLLRPVGTFSARQTFPPVMIGFAFNNLLPAHLGEFVRVFVFSRRYGVGKTAVLSTVVLERIFDILAILGYFFAGLAFTRGLPDHIQRVAWGFAGFVAVALLGAGIYLVWTKPFVALVENVLARIRFLPAGLRNKLCRLLEDGAVGLAAMRSGTMVFHILWSSVAQWALNGLMMHVALWSFGIVVSPLVSCLLLGVVAIGVTIPASPGYFGVVQAAFVLVVNQRTVGVANEPVFAASIYFHICQYIPVTLLGLYYFNRTGLSVAEVQHEAEAEEDELEEPLESVEAVAKSA